MSDPEPWILLAALPREIKSLVKGTPAEPALLREGIHLHRLPGALVAAGGMGAARVTACFGAALQAAEKEGKVAGVISIGLAGACTPSLGPGGVVEASRVIDSHTGERFETASSQDGSVLVSTATIASVQEKQRLHAAYGALLVDMEAATVGRLAHAHGMAFRAIKAVSDAHDFELASLGRFTGKRGHFRTGAFAMHTALRPHHWRHAATLGRNSKHALAGLTQTLRDLTGISAA